MPQDSTATQAKIDALSEAIFAVTNDQLNLDRVLWRLAEIAARMVNARYAALGVPNEEGGLENFFSFGMTDKQISQMDHLPLGLGLLGALLADTKPVRIDDMKQDPRSAGFCAHHPKMTSFLGVPIISRGKPLGTLYLCDRIDEQPFSEYDEQMVEVLARHAAIAIENARLSLQLRKLAVVEERDRIAMELHDGIIQSIYAVGLKLEIARTAAELPAVANSQIIAATKDLNHVIEDLRRYILDLKIGVSQSVTLAEQIQELADGFRGVSSARLVLDIANGFTNLTDAKVHAIVQIVRESFSNIVRHANATEVYLDLHEDPRQLTLTIADNGRGFDEKSIQLGRGLLNMEQRISQLGGRLKVTSKPGRGTTLEMSLPLKDVPIG